MAEANVTYPGSDIDFAALWPEIDAASLARLQARWDGLERARQAREKGKRDYE